MQDDIADRKKVFQCTRLIEDLWTWLRGRIAETERADFALRLEEFADHIRRPGKAG